MTLENPHTELPAGTMADGKRRLMDAALRLAAQGSSLSALGLRELGREAGLNHNTFYRHFSTPDELGAAVAQEVARDVMAAMKNIRLNAARHADATVGAAEYFYDYVLQHPQLFIVSVRELHSASTSMRRTLQTVIHDIASESVEQIVSLQLVPGLSPAALLTATSAITYYLFYRSLDCLDSPHKRDQIVLETVEFIRAQFLGMGVLQSSS